MWKKKRQENRAEFKRMCDDLGGKLDEKEFARIEWGADPNIPHGKVMKCTQHEDAKLSDGGRHTVTTSLDGKRGERVIRVEGTRKDEVYEFTQELPTGHQTIQVDHDVYAMIDSMGGKAQKAVIIDNPKVIALVEEIQEKRKKRIDKTPATSQTLQLDNNMSRF